MFVVLWVALVVLVVPVLLGMTAHVALGAMSFGQWLGGQFSGGWARASLAAVGVAATAVVVLGLLGVIG